MRLLVLFLLLLLLLSSGCVGASQKFLSEFSWITGKECIDSNYFVGCDGFRDVPRFWEDDELTMNGGVKNKKVLWASEKGRL